MLETSTSPGLGQGADPGADVDRHPADVVADQLDLAGVDARPGPRCPIAASSSRIGGGAADRPRRAVEGGEEAVARSSSPRGRGGAASWRRTIASWRSSRSRQRRSPSSAAFSVEPTMSVKRTVASARRARGRGGCRSGTPRSRRAIASWSPTQARWSSPGSSTYAAPGDVLGQVAALADRDDLSPLRWRTSVGAEMRRKARRGRRSRGRGRSARSPRRGSSPAAAGAPTTRRSRRRRHRSEPRVQADRSAPVAAHHSAQRSSARSRDARGEVGRLDHLRVGPVEDQRRDPLRVGGREQHRHRPALGDPEHGGALRAPPRRAPRGGRPSSFRASAGRRGGRRAPARACRR